MLITMLSSRLESALIQSGCSCQDISEMRQTAQKRSWIRP